MDLHFAQLWHKNSNKQPDWYSAQSSRTREAPC
jgi:hypothetical protein